MGYLWVLPAALTVTLLAAAAVTADAFRRFAAFDEAHREDD